MAIDSGAHRGGRRRDSRRDRRGPGAAGPRVARRGGSPRPTRSSSPGSTRTRSPTCATRGPRRRDGELGELVLLRDIEFRSICEHHLLPFRGVAHLAYLPGQRIVGLGRLPRVVETLASRPAAAGAADRGDRRGARGRPRAARACSSCSTPCTAASPRAAPGRSSSSTVTVASRGTLSRPGRPGRSPRPDRGRRRARDR